MVFGQDGEGAALGGGRADESRGFGVVGLGGEGLKVVSVFGRQGKKCWKMVKMITLMCDVNESEATYIA